MKTAFSRKKVEELLGSRDLCADRVLMDNCVVAIQKDMDYRTWANLLAQKNARIGKRFGHELVIAVGHNVSNWYDLTHSYEFAKYLLEHEFLFGGCSVMSMDTIENQGHIAENPSVDYFCMLIEVGDMDGIARVCEAVPAILSQGHDEGDGYQDTGNV